MLMLLFFYVTATEKRELANAAPIALFNCKYKRMEVSSDESHK